MSEYKILRIITYIIEIVLSAYWIFKFGFRVGVLYIIAYIILVIIYMRLGKHLERNKRAQLIHVIYRDKED